MHYSCHNQEAASSGKIAMTNGKNPPISEDAPQDAADMTEPANDAPSIEQGYCVKFYVYGDGSYGIGEPTPIAEGEDSDEEAHVPDLTSALKRLLNVVKTNPVGEDEEAQFQAGYNSGPAAGLVQ